MAGMTLPGFAPPTRPKPAPLPGPGGVQQFEHPDGGVSTSGSGAIPGAMPSMYQDPNSGNVFQWRPDRAGTNAGWQPFSRAPQGRPSGGRVDPSFDYARFSALSTAGGAGGAPRVAPPNPADRMAAERAAFSRAKDRTGQLTSGLMKAIGSGFEARGIGGSSLEADAMSGGLEAGQGELADLIRQQAISGLERDYEVEDRNYAGDITQRGQDLAQNGQKQNAILSLMKLIQSGVY